MPTRQDGNPVIVPTEGVVQRLERMPLGNNTLDEGRDLRDFVAERPDCLPVSQIDPSYAPLLPLGIEVTTDVGPMDCLFISPSGLLTIVETKLWRNPEARREVVGQIIDYAKEVARWSYTDLDGKCREKTGFGLWEYVNQHPNADKQISENEFIDQTTRALNDGTFLLLIVGDGIREDVERMASYLQAAPQLLFSLHLVELQVFELPNRARLVVPQLVARTAEVTRAVVHVHKGDPDIQVEVDVPAEKSRTAKSKDRLSEAEFLNQLEETAPNEIGFIERLIQDILKHPVLEIDWHSKSFTIKARDPLQPRNRFSLLNIDIYGKSHVFALRDQIERAGLPIELAQTYVEETARILDARVTTCSWSSVNLSTLSAHSDQIWAAIGLLLDRIRELSAAQNKPSQSG